MDAFRRSLFICIVSALLCCALFACGKTPEEERPADYEHVFTAWEVTKEPTEKEIGEVRLVCACGETEKMPLPALSASAYEVTERPAGCEEAGSRTYACKYGSFSVETAALGHEDARSEAKSVPPTCTTKGKTVYVCARCGREREETLDEAEHAYEVIEHEDGSCETGGEAGYTKYECSSCHRVLTLSYRKPHDFDDGEYTAAVCPAKGFTTYTCRDCGETSVVYDDAPRHEYDERGVCLVCGDVCRHEFDGYVCTKCGVDVCARVRADGYYLIDDDGDGACDVGERLYFGFYPTSVVGLSETKTLARLATAECADGVYVLGEERYVRVEVDQSRGGRNDFSDGSCIASYKTAYFRFEPVSWTIVSASEEGVTLFADRILDVTDFLAEDAYAYVAEKGEYYKKNGEEAGTVYADNWAVSDVRAYLNGTFRDLLVAASGAALLSETALDNADTNYYVTKKYAHGESTTDEVYLPAYADLFGEDEAYDAPSEARRKLSTDYAKARGLSLYCFRQNGGSSPYYLRSVGITSKNIAYVDGNGVFRGDGALCNEKQNGETLNGVGFVPMLRLHLPQASE